MQRAAPVIILVQPQLGENIGMAARAMMNCGLSELRLVRPRDDWPCPKACSAAAGADAVLDGVRVFADTATAVADLQRVYAATARVREREHRMLDPRGAAAALRDGDALGVRQGVLFGSERAGLINDDVALAHAVIRAPLNPDFTSLNLAQAVFLIAWEWWMGTPSQAAATAAAAARDSDDDALATLGDVDGFMGRLEAGLEQGGFFRVAAMRPRITRALRELFQRAALSAQDVRTLHGVVSALQRRRAVQAKEQDHV